MALLFSLTFITFHWWNIWGGGGGKKKNLPSILHRFLIHNLNHPPIFRIGFCPTKMGFAPAIPIPSKNGHVTSNVVIFSSNLVIFSSNLVIFSSNQKRSHQRTPGPKLHVLCSGNPARINHKHICCLFDSLENFVI